MKLNYTRSKRVSICITNRLQYALNLDALVSRVEIVAILARTCVVELENIIYVAECIVLRWQYHQICTYTQKNHVLARNVPNPLHGTGKTVEPYREEQAKAI